MENEDDKKKEEDDPQNIPEMKPFLFAHLMEKKKKGKS